MSARTRTHIDVQRFVCFLCKEELDVAQIVDYSFFCTPPPPLLFCARCFASPQCHTLNDAFDPRRTIGWIDVAVSLLHALETTGVRRNLGHRWFALPQIMRYWEMHASSFPPMAEAERAEEKLQTVLFENPNIFAWTENEDHVSLWCLQRGERPPPAIKTRPLTPQPTPTVLALKNAARCRSVDLPQPPEDGTDTLLSIYRSLLAAATTHANIAIAHAAGAANADAEEKAWTSVVQWNAAYNGVLSATRPPASSAAPVAQAEQQQQQQQQHHSPPAIGSLGFGLVAERSAAAKARAHFARLK